MKAVLEARKCPAVEMMCKPLQLCATGALRYVADEELPLGGKITIDQESCDGCGACVEACCGHAIALQE